jgi:hypothetical protein
VEREHESEREREGASERERERRVGMGGGGGEGAEGGDRGDVSVALQKLNRSEGMAPRFVE